MAVEVAAESAPARSVVPDHPWVPAVATLVAALVVVAARLVLAADGDISAFMVAGDEVFHPQDVQVHLEAGNGYDGQFSYRLALDPTRLDAAPVLGARLDGPTRAGRIAYPALAWAAAGGQAALVPWALVGVNLAGLGVLGWLAGRFAQLVGRHAIAGLLVTGWSGLLMTLARDLTEIVAVVGILGGLVALRLRRPWLAAAALVLAVLARETALAVPAALALVRAWQLLRPGPDGAGRARPGVHDLPWLAPVLALAAWQAVCWWAAGEAPLLASARVHLADPVVGDSATTSWLGVDGGARIGLKLAQASTLVVVAGLALRDVVRGAAGRAWEVVAWLIALVLALRVGALVWNDWASFRAYAEVQLLATVVVLAGPTRLSLLGAWLALVWLATAGRVALLL